MKPEDLLDAIGEAQDVYIQKATETSTVKKRLPFRRLFLIAAILGLLSATVASASEVLKIWIQYRDNFSGVESQPSSDPVDPNQDGAGGILEFQMDIDQILSGEPMQAVEVEPYFLTEADVQRVAYILFPEGEFYEAEADPESTYSKKEIQEKIDRWSRYATAEALLELIPYRKNQPDYQADIAETVNLFLQKYSEMLETAPEEDDNQPCPWVFRKTSYYWNSPSSSQNLENENDYIRANIQIGDVHYQLSASVRDKEDFLISNISVFLGDGVSPSMIDDNIFRAQLCRTEEPTQAQIATVKEKAAQMLRQMELGDWYIDECYVETDVINQYTDYIIHVNAVPMLNGAPAMRKHQLTNLRSEEENAPRYYYTDVQFEFSANGSLVSFQLMSPITIRNTQVSTSSAANVEAQLEIAKKFLSQRSFDTYSLGIIFTEEGEGVNCLVEITGLEYNLARINGEDPLDSYLYVPGIKLTGNVRYYGTESGETYLLRENLTLVILNGEDGSVMKE